MIIRRALFCTFLTGIINTILASYFYGVQVGHSIQFTLIAFAMSSVVKVVVDTIWRIKK